MQQHAKQKQQVFDDVCEKILAGDIRPGDRVSEKALARELNCSIIPVREALANLIALHVLKKIPHYGTFAPELEPAEMAEFVDFRVMAYTYAVGRAATDPVPRALEDLKLASEKFERKFRAGYEKNWDDASDDDWKVFSTQMTKNVLGVYWAILPIARMDVHFEFYRQADLLNVMQIHSIWDVLSRSSRMEHMMKMYVEHHIGCFIPAIEERDPNKAQRLHFERHMSAMRELMGRLDAAGSDLGPLSDIKVKLANAEFRFDVS